MKELRTNYVKLSLTNKEFEILQDLSENLDLSISGTIRKLINYATVVGLLGEAYMEARKKYPNDVKLIENTITDSNSIEDYAEKTEVLTNFIKDISSLAVFNIQWKQIGNQNSFSPILDLMKEANWNNPDFEEWLKEWNNKRLETNIQKK